MISEQRKHDLLEANRILTAMVREFFMGVRSMGVSEDRAIQLTEVYMKTLFRNKPKRGDEDGRHNPRK